MLLVKSCPYQDTVVGRSRTYERAQDNKGRVSRRHTDPHPDAMPFIVGLHAVEHHVPAGKGPQGSSGAPQSLIISPCAFIFVVCGTNQLFSQRCKGSQLTVGLAR
jgi:hypothetical protein